MTFCPATSSFKPSKMDAKHVEHADILLYMLLKSLFQFIVGAKNLRLANFFKGKLHVGKVE